MDAERIWNDILARLQARVNRFSFSTWFKPLILLRSEGNTLVIGVEHELKRAWLLTHYAADLHEAIEESGHDVSVQLVVQPLPTTFESRPTYRVS